MQPNSITIPSSELKNLLNELEHLRKQRDQLQQSNNEYLHQVRIATTPDKYLDDMVSDFVSEWTPPEEVWADFDIEDGSCLETQLLAIVKKAKVVGYERRVADES